MIFLDYREICYQIWEDHPRRIFSSSKILPRILETNASQNLRRLTGKILAENLLCSDLICEDQMGNLLDFPRYSWLISPLINHPEQVKLWPSRFQKVAPSRLPFPGLWLLGKIYRFGMSTNPQVYDLPNVHVSLTRRPMQTTFCPKGTEINAK